jgi:hypothetical protein
LFFDVDIPLLMYRFPDYGQTLNICNNEAQRTFTEVEQSLHHTDHALIGGIVARSWGLSPCFVWPSDITMTTQFSRIQRCQTLSHA